MSLEVPNGTIPDCQGEARFNTERQAWYVADGLIIEFIGSIWDVVAHSGHWHVRERPSETTP